MSGWGTPAQVAHLLAWSKWADTVRDEKASDEAKAAAALRVQQTERRISEERRRDA